MDAEAKICGEKFYFPLESTEYLGLFRTRLRFLANFGVLLSKALLIFDCTRTQLSLLEPCWTRFTSVKLHLTLHIARRTILNVPL